MGDATTCPVCGQSYNGDRPLTFAARNEISFQGRSVHVTAMEFELFNILLESYPKPIPRHEIMADLYEDRGDDNFPDSKIIDVYVSHIRTALRSKAIPIEILARQARGGRSGYALSF